MTALFTCDVSKQNLVARIGFVFIEFLCLFGGFGLSYYLEKKKKRKMFLASMRDSDCLCHHQGGDNRPSMKLHCWQQHFKTVMYHFLSTRSVNSVASAYK